LQVVTTVYATLGEQAVVDAVNELHSNTLLCNRTAVEKLSKHLSKVTTSLQPLVQGNPSNHLSSNHLSKVRLDRGSRQREASS